MGRFVAARLGSGEVPEFDGVSVSAARGTGNGVCGCRCGEDTGNGVCAPSCDGPCEDTGNRGCGSSRDRRVSPSRRGVVSLRDWWVTCVPAAPSIGAVAALYGSWHWKQGVFGVRSVACRSRMLPENWSRNVGGESA